MKKITKKKLIGKNLGKVLTLCGLKQLLKLKHLKKVVNTEFNIEGNPTKQFIDLVLDIKPTQVTLVPDAPDVLTSNKGWDIKSNYNFLKNLNIK